MDPAVADRSDGKGVPPMGDRRGLCPRHRTLMLEAGASWIVGFKADPAPRYPAPVAASVDPRGGP